MLNAICGGLVSVLAQTTEVPFVGEAICVTTSECDNHGKVESVTLTFSSTEYVPSSMPLAFIVTDVNGNSFLIGSREKPYPTIKHDITFGSLEFEILSGRYAYVWLEKDEFELNRELNMIPADIIVHSLQDVDSEIRIYSIE